MQVVLTFVTAMVGSVSAAHHCLPLDEIRQTRSVENQLNFVAFEQRLLAIYT